MCHGISEEDSNVYISLIRIYADYVRVTGWKEWSDDDGGKLSPFDISRRTGACYDKSSKIPL